MNFSSISSSSTEFEIENYSSKETSYIEDLSSIQNTSIQSNLNTPWIVPVNTFSQIPTTRINPLNPCAIYQENLKLKKKVEHLEATLRKMTPKNVCALPGSSNFTQSTCWRTCKKQPCFDLNESSNSLVRNLNKDFNEASNECNGTQFNKRERAFQTNKSPHKFLKIAMMNSIGALKF